MPEEKKEEPFRKRTEFDDALKGYYQDHDEVRPDELTDYRSLTTESIGSLICGFLSILTAMSIPFIVFPIMGIVLGLLAIRKILKASEVLGGLGMSSAGVALSVLFGTIGLAYLHYSGSYTTPTGYIDLSFEQLAPVDPRTGRIPPEIVALAQSTQLDGQRVFIEGYMYQTRKMTDIDRFKLVPYLDQSKFAAPTRKSTEMIDVNLQGDLRAIYRTSPVRVGGILYVNQDHAPGQAAYRIDADVFR